MSSREERKKAEKAKKNLNDQTAAATQARATDYTNQKRAKTEATGTNTNPPPAGATGPNPTPSAGSTTSPFASTAPPTQPMPVFPAFAFGGGGGGGGRGGGGGGGGGGGDPRVVPYQAEGDHRDYSKPWRRKPNVGAYTGAQRPSYPNVFRPYGHNTRDTVVGFRRHTHMHHGGYDKAVVGSRPTPPLLSPHAALGQSGAEGIQSFVPALRPGEHHWLFG